MSPHERLEPPSLDVLTLSACTTSVKLASSPRDGFSFPRSKKMEHFNVESPNLETSNRGSRIKKCALFLVSVVACASLHLTMVLNGFWIASPFNFVPGQSISSGEIESCWIHSFIIFGYLLLCLYAVAVQTVIQVSTSRRVLMLFACAISASLFISFLFDTTTEILALPQLDTDECKHIRVAEEDPFWMEYCRLDEFEDVFVWNGVATKYGFDPRVDGEGLKTFLEMIKSLDVGMFGVVESGDMDLFKYTVD